VTLIDDGYGVPEPLDGIVMAPALVKIPEPPGAVAPQREREARLP
jgi:hypothetical protein